MTNVSIRELSRNASGVVDEVTRTGRPALVTKRGALVAAVVAVHADDLEDFILANAPEYVQSMRDADEAIARDEPGIPLTDAIAELGAADLGDHSE